MFTFICISILKSELSLEITRLKSCKRFTSERKKGSTEDMKKKKPSLTKKASLVIVAEQLACGKNNN
jgi:hypothetical protein